ncbi:MAG: hypothetical protein M3R24_17105, partial [Chloroflexota bacterium]|nr:hypothetical protein [Chloroflexota bacterium]
RPIVVRCQFISAAFHDDRDAPRYCSASPSRRTTSSHAELCHAVHPMVAFAHGRAMLARYPAVPGSPHDDHWPWYDTFMQNTELEALACRTFPAAMRIIILPAGDPGATLFHDADAMWQAAGIAATSWDEATGTLYLRRLPSATGLSQEPSSPGPSI